MKPQLFFLAFLLCLSSIAQNPGTLSKKISEQLKACYTQNPPLKCAVITDKEIYRPGDIIWFETEILNDDTHLPDKTVKDIQVRLYSEDGKLLQSDKYDLLSNGRANGDFKLPTQIGSQNIVMAVVLPGTTKAEKVYLKPLKIQATYQEGVTFSLAEAPDFLKKKTDNAVKIQVRGFDGTIEAKQRVKCTVSQGSQIILDDKLKTDDNGNISLLIHLPEGPQEEPVKISLFDYKSSSSTSFRLAAANEKVKLDFYSEGGTIIEGTPIKTGFYVQTVSGRPVSVQGKITDNDGKEVLSVKSLAPGYGLFSFQAEKGKLYTMTITDGPGEGQMFRLPAANPTGTLLSVAKTDSSFLSTNLMFADKLSHSVSLIISSEKDVVWSSDLNVNGAARVKIPIENIPQGISRITCFSTSGIPLAERLIYINKGEETNIQISAPESVKKGQTFRTSIKLSNENGQALAGRISLSICELTGSSHNRQALSSDFRFGSILQNPVELTTEMVEQQYLSKKNIDFYLIANAMDDYDWSQIFNCDIQKQKTNIPVIAGNFPDDNKAFNEQLSARIQQAAMNYQAEPLATITPEYYKQNNGLFTKVPHRSSEQSPSREPAYKKLLETSTSLLDVIKTIKPFTLDGEKIIFPGGNNSFMAQGGALIVIDGQNMGESASVLNNVNIHDVDKINISTQPMDIQRYTGLNSVGLIEITTFRGTTGTQKPVASVEKNLYSGNYRVPRRFETIAEKEKDLRPTMYWNAEIHTSDGQIEIDIPASQITSDFRILVESFSENGETACGSKTIKVTE